MEEDHIGLTILVSGRVQGVGFRYFTKNIADRLELKGWVRNTIEGNVEIQSYGERKVLEEFLEIIKKGTSVSYIKDTQVEWKKTIHRIGNNFEIRY